VSENECNGLTTAKYLAAAEDTVVQNPPSEQGDRVSPHEATRRPGLLASTTLFSIVFALAAGLGLGYQIGLPVVLKKASTVWGDVAKPWAGLRSPQTAFQKFLIKNHDDIMAEIQQGNKANPVTPHLEKLTREGWPQQDWNNVGPGGFQPAPFKSFAPRRSYGR
jgi:hypothetical protein